MAECAGCKAKDKKIERLEATITELWKAAREFELFISEAKKINPSLHIMAALKTYTRKE